MSDQPKPELTEEKIEQLQQFVQRTVHNRLSTLDQTILANDLSTAFTIRELKPMVHQFLCETMLENRGFIFSQANFIATLTNVICNFLETSIKRGFLYTDQLVE